jgi:polyphosphate kinase 2 (PPK2 family)
LWMVRHRAALEKLTRGCLTATDHALARWHRIEGANESKRLLEVGRLLRNELRAASRPTVRASAAKVASPRYRAAGEAVSAGLEEKDYERELAELQRRLALLVRRKRFRKHAVVLAFEGMDAAGKGGAIRRVTHALDARQYQVVPVSAPNEEERAYPYLWRFWRHVPKLGAITIYDRSWYGRVLVERVRGLTPAADWRRAYEEICEFERQLVEDGIIVAKFWLDVSKAEQLRRFRARNEDPLKRFKVDAEDWKNRRFFDAYRQAASEMIERTDAEEARWTIVPANDKKLARLIVLRTVCETIERALE